MRLFTLLILALLWTATPVLATHNRSGELTYKHLGGNTYEVTVVTFTEPSSVAADRDSLIVCWGDGTCDTIPRVQIINLNGNVKQNIYRGQHTYSGFGCFTISMQDLNRVTGVQNINNGASVDIPFYVESDLCLLDPAIWGPQNNSPVFGFPAIDTAYVNLLFEHPLGLIDPDNDSLVLTFYTPLQNAGFAVNNYTPLNVLHAGSTISLNQNTFTFVWDKPTQTGVVNIGIEVTEYRRRYNPDGSLKGVIKIGSVKRDLQIFILADNNQPPVIANIFDTCVVAGSVLMIPVQATDANAGQTVTASATGGPFQLLESPATLTQTSPTGTLGLWTGNLIWQTTCNHVNPGYYVVTVLAKDNYTGGPASDVHTFRIKVVAPAPENLTATPQGNSIVLDWQNPYVCSSATRFRGFSVWRREGPNPFEIDTCTPGLAGRGYVRIATNLQTYTFTDTDVQIGRNYCYRVLAEFGATTSLGWVLDFVESLPSNEVCSQLKRDLPVMTNVSVEVTDQSNGTMYVAWSNPKTEDFDTIQNPGPYVYRLYRKQGFPNAAGNYTLVQTFTAPSFYLLDDTTFVDSGLNTDDHPYSYFVSFFANNGADSLGRATPASSVFLTVNFASNALILSWQEDVPWMNYAYVIHRYNPVTTSFESIDTVPASPYTDTGLLNDSTYCYRIESIGGYSAPGIVSPILNWSQEECGVPKDTVGPCPPILAVLNTCNTDNFQAGEFTNLLQWNVPPVDCGGDAIKYYVYYTPSPLTAFVLLDSFNLVTDTTFEHFLQNTIAGCYAVAAVDSYYNRGPLSNVVCLENCPLYNLPNTFTPNNDGRNDVFHPLLPYRFIERVNMRIYTSWGSLVFETTDPEIGWNGVNQKTSRDVPEGTYYYVCEVFETRVGSTGKADHVLNGFIHLYR